MVPSSVVIERSSTPLQRPSTRARRILALHWYDVCSPWRVTIPLGGLQRAGIEWRQAHIKEERIQLDNTDLILMHRPNSTSALRVLQEARERSIPVVVDVDDLFLAEELPPSAPFTQVWSADFKRREAEAQARAGLIGWDAVEQAEESQVMQRFHACLRAADLVTVSTPQLAEVYAQFNDNVQVLPNAFDDSNPLWNISRPVRSTVSIGFAGTDHHLDNLELLRGALEPVLRSTPQARLVEAGGPALLPLIDAAPEQLMHLGTQPFATFPLLLAEMDIVVAPLADTLFMRSKSNIRCMTAGLLGIPVVASPVGPYAEYVEHGVNGFLASTRDEWSTAIARLVADAGLRTRMGEANRARAQRFSISNNYHRWANAYDSLLDRRRRA